MAGTSPSPELFFSPSFPGLFSVSGQLPLAASTEYRIHLSQKAAIGWGRKTEAFRLPPQTGACKAGRTALEPPLSGMFSFHPWDLEPSTWQLSGCLGKIVTNSHLLLEGAMENQDGIYHSAGVTDGD